MNRFSKRAATQRALTYIIPMLIFIVMLVWFIIAVANAGKSTEQKELSAIKTTIENGITMCYAIEGAYPVNIDYLTDNYGVIYDSEKYIVHYDCFADNVRPTVRVLERRSANERL